MRLSKNSGKIFWGLLFILAAAYLVACKFWSLPSISIFTILLTVFLVTIIIKGIKHVNFWEILFPIAFLCILYDEPLGINIDSLDCTWRCFIRKYRAVYDY